MAAGLAIPVAGPYISSWFALPLGVQNDDGYRLTCTIQGQEMNATDQFGKTLVEGVYQGQNWRVRLTGLEWKAGLVEILQMFGNLDPGTNGLQPTLSGATVGNLNNVVNVGDLWTHYTGPLVMTAVLGNPPTTPQSLTASNAGIAPEQSSEFMFTSKIRELPLEMVLIPYNTTIGSIRYAVPFTTL